MVLAWNNLLGVELEGIVRRWFVLQDWCDFLRESSLSLILCWFPAPGGVGCVQEIQDIVYLPAFLPVLGFVSTAAWPSCRCVSQAVVQRWSEACSLV